MKYNNYDNWYKWSNIGTYICQVCSQEIRETQRMRFSRVGDVVRITKKEYEFDNLKNLKMHYL